MKSSAVLVRGRGKRSEYFDAQLRSGPVLLQVNIFSTQRNKIQYHFFLLKKSDLCFGRQESWSCLAQHLVLALFASLLPDCSTNVHGARKWSQCNTTQWIRAHPEQYLVPAVAVQVVI
jgi:hypothetical protein